MDRALAKAACPPAFFAARDIAFMFTPTNQLPVDIIHQLTIEQVSCDHQLMVEPQKLRDEFADRLNRALDETSGVRRGRGRNTDLHRLVKEAGGRASTQATNKWLNGESIPDKPNILALSKATGVRAEWLEYGIGSMQHDQLAAESSDKRSSTPGRSPIDYRHTTNVEPGPAVKGRVPLISWVQAGDWCEAIDNFAPGDAEEWLPCPFEHSDTAFCLEVVGLSMSPDYREDEIIAIDPSVDAVHGNDVVCRTPDGNVTFKRLQITPDGTYLLALNPDWPNRMIAIPENTRICGVVIGSWMRRR